MAAKLRVTYVKSAIGYPERQKRSVQSLGLRRLHQAVVVDDTPTMRGLVESVRHLVHLEEVQEES